MGADDFIRKPFSQRLLVERVKAILRRAGGKDASAVVRTEDAKALERGLWLQLSEGGVDRTSERLSASCPGEAWTTSTLPPVLQERCPGKEKGEELRDKRGGRS